MRWLLVFLLFAVLFAIPVFAQDGNHGVDHTQGHDWYKELKQPGTGYSCCNGTINGIEGDCRPTRAFKIAEGQTCGSEAVVVGQWCALVDGKWKSVPLRSILEKLAPDGNSHICASKSGMIFCFIGGSPKS